MMTTTMRSAFSLTVFSITAPPQPPIAAAIAVTPTCAQWASLEKAKIATAEAFIAAASARVARINAAYDVIKRERRL